MFDFHLVDCVRCKRLKTLACVNSVGVKSNVADVLTCTRQPVCVHSNLKVQAAQIKLVIDLKVPVCSDIW